MSKYTYKLANGRTKTVTIKDGKPELYSELEWAMWLDINSMEKRHLDDQKRIEGLEATIKRVSGIKHTVHPSWNASDEFAAGWKACRKQVGEALEQKDDA